MYAPLDCVGCGIEGCVVCPSCAVLLSVPDSRCYRCNNLSARGKTCVDCRVASKLISVNSAVAYEGLAKDLVWRLKFGRVQAAADTMAMMIVERYGSQIAADVLIVPVPTASKRVRGRGYDQAVLIARAIAIRTGCLYAPLLSRVGSQEQIGAGKSQRRQQLEGVFSIKNASRVPNARLLLIDDVITTGATLETAATALVRAGARSVGALAFARAQLRS